MPWPRSRYKTAAPGGVWTPDDMNGWQDQFVRPDGLVADDLSSALAGQLGVNQTGAARRGYAEVLSEHPSNLPDPVRLRLLPGADLWLVYASAEIRCRDPVTVTLSISSFVDGRSMGRWTAEATPDYRETSPVSFLVMPEPTGSGVELAVFAGGNVVWIRNARLWAVSLI